MSSDNAVLWPGRSPWRAWQKLIFSFLFAYFMLFIEPWSLLGIFPKSDLILHYYSDLKSWLVYGSNNQIFHTYKDLITPNGSGDTSYGWTEVKLNLIIALAAALIWSILSFKTPDHNKAAYWLRIFLRYTLIINCFGYGLAKVFLMQMSFPSLSNLATPLGDLLPMRLSWLFIGYSGKYQFFLGMVECVAGLLLIFRRTTTLGTLLCAGIFMNVAIMNLSYDIPVKIFSIHLLGMSLLLLSFEYHRLVDIFIRNIPAIRNNLYDVYFPKRWMRVGINLVKYAYVIFFLYSNISSSYEAYISRTKPAEVRPFTSGLYDVSLFVINKDTLPPLITDSLRWKDVVLDYGNGSINTVDTIFWQRYRRGYFRYTTDSVNQLIHFRKRDWTWKEDSLFTMKYQMPDTATIILSGKIRNDSVYAVLRRSNRHFQLAEKQFHWLSEYNR